MFRSSCLVRKVTFELVGSVAEMKVLIENVKVPVDYLELKLEANVLKLANSRFS